MHSPPLTPGRLPGGPGPEPNAGARGLHLPEHGVHLQRLLGSLGADGTESEGVNALGHLTLLAGDGPLPFSGLFWLLESSEWLGS